ncbi:dephospho-CoA kinase [Guggenheimella bovis]
MKYKHTYAITGAISSGKSAVGEILRELGYPVIDSDQIARKVVEPNTEGLRRIEEAFPEVVVEGILDRKKLAKRIFHSEEERIKLNELLHPLIRKESDEILTSFNSLSFYEAPLLFEVGIEHDFKGVIYVDSAFKLERLMNRDGIDEAYAKKKLQSFKRPDFPFTFIVWNNGSKEALKETVKKSIIWLKKNA